MSEVHPALGRQFHATSESNVPKLEREGFRLDRHGGYGEQVRNMGRGVYTASEHDAQGWASNMRSWNDSDERLKVIPVEYDPKAKVHTYNSHRDTGHTLRRVTMEEHLAQHPDVAKHFNPDHGEMDGGVRELARATQKAGYDALHRPSWTEGGMGETLWFDPSKVRPAKKR